MTPDEETQAQHIAADIAAHELLRMIIADVYYTDDRPEFRRRLSAIENAAVAGISGRRHFEHADDEAEIYIKEAASGFVSRLIGSISHPSDPQR